MFEVKIYIETSLKGPLRAGEGEGWYAAVFEYREKSRREKILSARKRQHITSQCYVLS